MTNIKRNSHTERGFTLLVAVVTASIVLAIGTSILNITLKQYMLSAVARDSEMAYYAAEAGAECVQYWDESTNGGQFNLSATPPATINCMDGNFAVGGYTGSIGPGEEGSVELTTTSGLCSKVTISKASCGVGCTETTLKAKGYNRACANIATDPRVVERAIRSKY